MITPQYSTLAPSETKRKIHTYEHISCFLCFHCLRDRLDLQQELSLLGWPNDLVSFGSVLRRLGFWRQDNSQFRSDLVAVRILECWSGWTGPE